LKGRRETEKGWFNGQKKTKAWGKGRQHTMAFWGQPEAATGGPCIKKMKKGKIWVKKSR